MKPVKKTACLMLFITTSLSAIASPGAAQNGAAGAQQSKAVESKPVDEKSPPLDPKKKILRVLDQQLEIQKGFSDESLRVAIQTDIADMLWTYDETRARRLLEEAFQSISNIKVNERGLAVTLSYGVCTLVIRTIARRDPAMALRLQQSIEIPANVDPKTTVFGNTLYAVRARMQNDFAMYVLMDEIRAGDTQHSLKALRLLAERGDLQRLIPHLRQIRAKDPVAADDMFIQAIEKTRLGRPGFDEIRNLTWYVFPNFGEGVFRFSEKRGDPFETNLPGGVVMNQLLDLAFSSVMQRLDAALANADGARLDARSFLDYSLPKLLVPYFDRFMPERAAAFRARVEEVLRRVPAEEQPYLALSEPGIQGLLAVADKVADERTRDSLYRTAATRAKYSGDLDQAFTIAEKISHEPTRSNLKEELRTQLDYQRIQETYKAVGANDFDKAETIVGEISDWKLRLQAFGSLIGGLSRKDKAKAIAMLDEAERNSSSVGNPTERAWQLKMLAGIAARIDTSRGFQKMGLAIEEFNRAGFAPEWEKYQEIETPGSVIKKRIYIGLSVLLDDADFSWLGQTDLDRALTVAQQIQMKEASALAQLAVCRGMLWKVQPQRPPLTEKQKEAEKKALALLDQLLETTKSFEDEELRIRVQVQVADMLWARDERRARRLFEAAFEAIASTRLPPQEKNRPPSYVGSDSHFPLRNDVIRMVTQHDPVLAARLIDTVVDQPPNVDPQFRASPYGTYSEQDLLRFQFALQIAQTDSPRAAQIAAMLSQKGDIQHTISILEALGARDSSQADDLFAQTLSRVKQAKATSSETIRLLASYVFGGDLMQGGGMRILGGSRRPPEIVKANPALAAQFLDFAYSSLMKPAGQAEQNATPNSRPDGRDRGELMIATSLLPFFDEYMPEKSSALRARFSEAANKKPNNPELEDLQQLLNRADQANANERDRIYSNGIMNALQRLDLDRASQLLEKISDEKMRPGLERALAGARDRERYGRAQSAMNRGEFDAAYKLINEISDRNQRFGMLCNMAVSLSYRNDTPRASEVLKEAEQLSAKTEDRFARAQEALQLAGVAGRIDIERGFEEMKRAVDAINQADISPEWTRLENLTDPKSGAVIGRRFVGLQSLASFLNDNTFPELARADFDRALRLAQGVQLKEASVLAQLGVCRGALNPRNGSR